MGKVIEVRDLYKLYRVGDEIVRALDGVNFDICEGEFCAIVGTSGSGKSTLLNMLAGLEKPTKGSVVIAGQHIETLNEDQLVRFRRDNVGFIFQSFHLLGTMNAVENVALPLSFRGIPRDIRLKKADKMLDLVNLKKHKKHLPNQMSGGQQQRVDVARALVVDPKIRMKKKISIRKVLISTLRLKLLRGYTGLQNFRNLKKTLYFQRKTGQCGLPALYFF